MTRIKKEIKWRRKEENVLTMEVRKMREPCWENGKKEEREMLLLYTCVYGLAHNDRLRLRRSRTLV